MCCVMGAFGTAIPMDEFRKSFLKTKTRGPDADKMLEFDNAILGFQRLAIMGLDPSGMQPFKLGTKNLVCNGEIYGVFGADKKSRSWRSVRQDLKASGFDFRSDSDCEVLLPLYNEMGTDLFKALDAEYALIIYDEKENSVVAARDPIGIRPLYYGKGKKGGILFASEPKNLEGLTDEILPFPPGHYYKDGKFVCYRDMTKVESIVKGGLDGDDGICVICKVDDLSFADILAANPQIDAVYSLDDETSIGVLQAIADAGRTDIKAITGGGGCQEYFGLIAENKDIAVSSSLYSPLMIRDCFDVALAKLAGEEVEAVTVIPSQIVDASNVEQYLDPSNTIY